MKTSIFCIWIEISSHFRTYEYKNLKLIGEYIDTFTSGLEKVNFWNQKRETNLF